MKRSHMILALAVAGSVLCSAATACRSSAYTEDEVPGVASEISLRTAHLAHQELLRRLPEGRLGIVKGFAEAPKRVGLEPAPHEPGVARWKIVTDAELPEILVTLQLIPLELVDEPLFVVESFGMKVEGTSDSPKAAEVLQQLRR